MLRHFCYAFRSLEMPNIQFNAQCLHFQFSREIMSAKIRAKMKQIYGSPGMFNFEKNFLLKSTN